MRVVSLLVVALGCAVFLTGLFKERISLIVFGGLLAFGGTVLWEVE